MSKLKSVFSNLTQAQAMLLGSVITVVIGGIIGGIINEFFEIRRTQIPIEATQTAEMRSTATVITQDIVYADLVSSSIYSYNGFDDQNVGDGIGTLFVERNKDSDLDYKLEYKISEQTDGYAGFVFRFSPALDVSKYDFLEVTLSVQDTGANCDVYLKEGNVANYIRVCDSSFINGSGIESSTSQDKLTVKIPLRLNFKDVDQTKVDEIGFSANAAFTTGNHSFTVHDVKLMK